MNGITRLGKIFERKGDITVLPLSNITEVSAGNGKWGYIKMAIPEELAQRLFSLQDFNGGLIITTNTEIEAEKALETKEERAIRIDYQAIVDLYNSICVSFPQCTKLSSRRKTAIAARIKSGYTFEQFKTMFQLVEENTFLKGKNDRNFRATFDWLIKDANMAKVLDGNYDFEKKEKEPEVHDAAWKDWQKLREISAAILRGERD